MESVDLEEVREALLFARQEYPGSPAVDALVAHHGALAEGGVGLTTVAYCAVSDAGRTFEDQLTLQPASHPALRRLTDRVHTAGGAASLQLGHCGFFTKLGPASGPPRSASRVFNAYGAVRGLAFSRAMTEDEIEQVISFICCDLISPQRSFK